MPTPLSPQQMLAVQVSERVMSVLSVLGSFFIIATFLRWSYFRKPINRLVFYASFGNVLANTATLIATSSFDAQKHSRGLAPLCEFQGVIIQWFVMADSLWVLCMALNVMFVFFRGYNHRQLRHIEPYYFICSYGLPSLPVIGYLIIDHVTSKPAFGPATIWCWVSRDYEWMRLAFFYGPVWVVICFTASIYIVTGRRIFQKRALLRSFSRRSACDRIPVLTNPFTAGTTNIERKTDIHVVTETVDSEHSAACPNDESRSSFASTRNLATRPLRSQPSRIGLSQTAWEHSVDTVAPVPTSQGSEHARGYTVTVSAHHPMMSPPPSTPLPLSTHRPPMIRRTAAAEGNAAAWGYMKVAFLMFTALFIVWVPSTVNRVQQLIHEDQPIFALNLASALVLPLQGFWNAMVYMATTWPECQRALASVINSMRNKPASPTPEASRKHEELSQRKDSSRDFTQLDDDDLELDLNQMLNQVTPPPSIHTRETSKGSTIFGRRSCK